MWERASRPPRLAGAPAGKLPLLLLLWRPRTSAVGAWPRRPL